MEVPILLKPHPLWDLSPQICQHGYQTCPNGTFLAKSIFHEHVIHEQTKCKNSLQKQYVLAMIQRVKIKDLVQRMSENTYFAEKVMNNGTVDP